MKNNLHFVDELTLLFAAGSNIVIYHSETKTQKFVPATDGYDGLTTLAISENKRNLAIAERADKPIITIYDLHTLRKRKVLTSDGDSKVIHYFNTRSISPFRFLMTPKFSLQLQVLRISICNIGHGKKTSC